MLIIYFILFLLFIGLEIELDYIIVKVVIVLIFYEVIIIYRRGCVNGLVVLLNVF